MKRVGNLFEKIIEMDNIIVADNIARKGKKSRYGIELHDRNREENLTLLQKQLADGSYKTSPYKIFNLITDFGKERTIYRLPYYPDRIAHHSIMNILEQYFDHSFIRNTFCCIKNRGIHDGVKHIKSILLKDRPGTKYCLKMDVKKFYPSVDHDILKSILRRKFKDPRLLSLLDEIIDSAPGLPIGNYLSQYFSNFYLNYFDHWLKEKKHVKYYFRYADDMVILSSDKNELHALRKEISQYLENNLKLKLKENWQVFPIESRGIDFLGYVFYHDHIMLRKRIKKRFARKMAKNNKNPLVVSSYKGWCQHGNCINLFKKITGMNLFSELGIELESAPMLGEKIRINKIVNQEIEVLDFEVNKSKFEKSGSQYLKLQIKFNEEKRVVFTGAKLLINAAQKIKKEQLPFETVIVEQNGFYQFT